MFKLYTYVCYFSTSDLLINYYFLAGAYPFPLYNIFAVTTIYRHNNYYHVML